MTQALNLANFANNLNTAGATSNSGLQNSSVTVTAGTGMSGGGAVALGSSVTLTNAGVTSVAAGTGISVSASTGGVTITNTSSASGTVTSVATGNGLQGGTITTSGTLSVACPTFNTVGSYVFAVVQTTSPTSGGNYSAGSGGSQIQTLNAGYGNASGCYPVFYWNGSVNNLSGTWKWLGGNAGQNSYTFGIACRVA